MVYAGKYNIVPIHAFTSVQPVGFCQYPLLADVVARLIHRSQSLSWASLFSSPRVCAGVSLLGTRFPSSRHFAYSPFSCGNLPNVVHGLPSPAFGKLSLFLTVCPASHFRFDSVSTSAVLTLCLFVDTRIKLHIFPRSLPVSSSLMPVNPCPSLVLLLHDIVCYCCRIAIPVISRLFFIFHFLSRCSVASQALISLRYRSLSIS